MLAPKAAAQRGLAAGNNDSPLVSFVGKGWKARQAQGFVVAEGQSGRPGVSLVLCGDRIRLQRR